MAKSILTSTVRGLLVAMGTLAVLCAAGPSATAAGQCEPDNGGGCVRADGFACAPSSDNPPAKGGCYTVKQDRVLKCLCLATPPRGLVSPRPIIRQGGGVNTGPGATTNAECINKCDRAQIACRAEARTQIEMLKCGRAFQACVAECDAPHPH
jgi:hypothetical protein